MNEWMMRILFWSFIIFVVVVIVIVVVVVVIFNLKLHLFVCLLGKTYCVYILCVIYYDCCVLFIADTLQFFILLHTNWKLFTKNKKVRLSFLFHHHVKVSWWWWWWDRWWHSRTTKGIIFWWWKLPVPISIVAIVCLFVCLHWDSSWWFISLF